MSDLAGATLAVSKVPTGIDGFDGMTGGGLAVGRVAAVLGAAGAGKTVFAMQALAHMVRASGGTGVFVSFEQDPDSVMRDMSSFDWRVTETLDAGKLLVLDGRPRTDAIQSGKFDISGLLAAIEAAIPEGPAFVVFDGIDVFLTMLISPMDQRAELLRIQEFNWRRQATTLMTIKASGKYGSGFEEMALYMVDCVIELESIADEGLIGRRVRVQKYRSSSHVENWSPYIIGSSGIEVSLIDPNSIETMVSSERVSTGVTQLDAMLGGGVYRGSTTLLSGSPGTSKTTLATRLIEAACKRGERSLCVCFDEAPEEIVRNVSSVGTHLAPEIESGRLLMIGLIARSAGPDYLANQIIKQIIQHGAQFLMIDPVSVFTDAANSQNALRLIFQHCKRSGITVILTSLLEGSAGEIESSQAHVSTLCDNWIHLSYVLKAGERNRAMTIIKSRGTAHSNQVAELLLTRSGISIADAYTEDGEVLMGSLRWQKERSNQRAIEIAKEQAAQQQRDVERSVQEIANRIAILNSELQAKKEELQLLTSHVEQADQTESDRREQVSRMRLGGTELAGDEKEEA